MSAEGFAMIPNWLVRDTTVSAHAKLVFVVLASHTSSAGATFVGHKRIAAEAGISVSSVQRALRELRDRGAVTWRQRRRDGAGDLTTSEYRIQVTSGQRDRTVQSEGPDRPVTVTDEVDVLEVDVPEARRARGSMGDKLTAAGLDEAERAAFIEDLRQGGVRSPSALVAKLAKNGGLADRIAEFRAVVSVASTADARVAAVQALKGPSRVQQNTDAGRRLARIDGHRQTPMGRVEQIAALGQEMQTELDQRGAMTWPQLEIAGAER